ncbi:hypothetical protein J7L02_00925 [Candidatus Woesearchaeota archaeon]|nr:hypothetical protein [Candidatus Woesearchaeota archaeon]
MLDKIIQKLEPVYTKIKNYRSKDKIKLDQYLDPALFLIASNAGYAYIADQLLNQISEHSGNYEEVAMFASYIALAAGLPIANKKWFLPIAKKIYNLHKKRFRKTKATALSWVRTLSQVLALTIALNTSSFSNTLNNYKTDLSNIKKGFTTFVKSFSRKDRHQYLEDLLENTDLDNASPRKLHKKVFQTGSLQGKYVNGLFADYLGVKGRVPETIQVDPQQLLIRMWNKKLNISHGNDAVKQIYNKKVLKYSSNNHHYSSLDNFLKEIDNSINNVYKHLDWDMIAEVKNLNKKKLNLLKKLAEKIDAKAMLAYGLTELMPKEDPDLNKQVLDFILKNYGVDYLMLIPAMHDGYASFGLWQLTSLAVYEVEKPNGKIERRGASIINQALPDKYKIPGSLVLFNNEDHIKAAYLFAINNLAELIRDLTSKQLNTLSSKVANHYDEHVVSFIEFIATSHNNPSSARAAAKRWLDNEAESEYIVSCANSIKEYASKTRNNYSALIGSSSHQSHNFFTRKSKHKTRNNEFRYLRINSEGKHVFTYKVQSGDYPLKIAKRFNEWDSKHSDLYEEAGFKNVVNRYGRFIGRVYPSQKVYVVVKPKHKRET